MKTAARPPPGRQPRTRRSTSRRDSRSGTEGSRKAWRARAVRGRGRGGAALVEVGYRLAAPRLPLRRRGCGGNFAGIREMACVPDRDPPRTNAAAIAGSRVTFDRLLQGGHDQ